MVQTGFIVLIVFLPLRGHLSANETLFQVGLTRQTKPVLATISTEIDISSYSCRVGLPYGYAHYIGREIWFQGQDQEIYGPWLVTDVAAIHHAGIMESRDLIADIDCLDLVHLPGRLFIKIEVGCEQQMLYCPRPRKFWQSFDDPDSSQGWRLGYTGNKTTFRKPDTVRCRAGCLPQVIPIWQQGRGPSLAATTSIVGTVKSTWFR